MVVLTIATEKGLAVPADEQIVCDTHTLAAAFHLAFLAGQAENERENETWMFLERTLRNMRRGMRRPRPTPREGIEAGIDLMLRAIEERRGIHLDLAA